MKIFISWSGEASHKIAKALHVWLPILLQYVRPFTSSEEIEKGARWSSTVAQELENTNFGLLCLTPDNLDARWIYFEAGALAKLIDQSRVAPLLYNLKPSDVQGPLAQFQLTGLNYEDMRRLVFSIDTAAGAASLDPSRLEKAYEALWPKFDDEIRGMEASEKPSQNMAKPTSAETILEELLSLSRQQTQLLASSELFRPMLDEVRWLNERLIAKNQSISEEDVEIRGIISAYIVNKVRISNIVGLYVKLEKAGPEFRALCPFHNEKTPSFSVVESKGFFHCFGCGAHGTAIDFIMAMEDLTFAQAIKNILGDLT